MAPPRGSPPSPAGNPAGSSATNRTLPVQTPSGGSAINRTLLVGTPSGGSARGTTAPLAPPALSLVTYREDSKSRATLDISHTNNRRVWYWHVARATLPEYGSAHTCEVEVLRTLNISRANNRRVWYERPSSR